MTTGSFCVRLDVHTWRRVTLLALLTLLLFTALPEHANVGAPPVAYAQSTPAVYVVKSTDDTAIDRLECLDPDSHCSLRGAIEAANTHAGADTIRFGLRSCIGICTINLNSPLPAITDSLTITGLGPENLVVRRNQSNNSTTLSDFYRIFTIDGTITVSISGMSITNGYARVLNPGTSTVGQESAGGGVLVRNATVTITNCTIGGNVAEFRGGGITNYAGTVTVIESTIANNSNGPTTPLGESAGGGIYTSGTLTVRRSAILSNDTTGKGGGIAALGAAAIVIVENSTIAQNDASRSSDGMGGGILNLSGNVTVKNSTIVLNKTAYSGGGIVAELDTTPNPATAATHVKSSIVALNTTEVSGDSGPDIGGNIIQSDGFNLIGIKDAIGVNFNKATDKTGTAASPLDPQFDSLGFHGGPTRNFSLQPTSPALDAGISNGLMTDQRGAGFDRTSDDEAIVNATGGDGTDIGSFEVPVPDTVPPAIHCTVPTQTLWYATDVPVSCTASDTKSGLANAADASFTLTTTVGAGTETSSAMTTTRSVCDNEGNCATAGAYAFKVDKKGPVLACIAASYLLNAVNATVSATVTDGGSGAAVTPATVTATTSPVGAKTATITGTDLVGNSTTVSCPYQINYAFTGFLSPIKNPPLVNTGNAGRGYVLSWKLQDANGTFINALSAFSRVRTTVSTPCTIPSGSGQPNGGSNPKGTVHYDPTTNTYGYNWSSPRTAGCYEVRVELDSGQAFSALFELF